MACATGLLIGACAAHPDPDPLESTGAADAVTADWIHPACSSDALQPPASPADACNGPWAFSYVESWVNRGACGQDTTLPCETYNSCTSWDVTSPGDGQGTSQSGPSTENSGSFSYSCKTTGNHSCTGNVPDGAVCANVATTRRNTIIAGLAPGAPSWATAAVSVTSRPLVTSTEPDPENHAVISFYTCTLTIDKVPSRTTGARPVCGCAQYPAKSCTRLTGSVTTSPGQSRPASPGTPTFAGDTRVFAAGGAPSCLTCDQLPIDTDANVQAKLACLDGQRATATGDLRSSLVARMKLLFQVAGERLTPAQRTQLEALYDSDPDTATSCSVPVAWDAACRTEANALNLPPRIQLCSDLALNDHTSLAIATAELPRCLAQLAGTTGLPTETCRLATRDAADAAAQGVLGKTYPALSGDLSTQLVGVLASIDQWWTAASTAAAGDRSWLLGHSNTTLRQLWAVIEQGKLPLPLSGALTNDTAAAALLANVAGTGFDDDFGVLAALFAPGQGSLPPPLLTLTGDALQPITDRLARLEAIHDVGCRFASCRTVISPTNITLRASATTELVHVLAVLADHDALAAALTAASHLAAQQPVLYAALTRIRDQHGYLDSAWTALGRSEPFAQLATITDPPAEASALAAIVRTATIAWASYAESGEFAPWHRARLTTAALQQPALVTFIDSLRAQVTTSRATYETQRLNTVKDLLDQSHGAGALQSAVDRMAALRDQDSDLVGRALGLESRDADERAALASYQQAFEALIAANVLDSNAAYQSQTLAPITVSAADAHYPGTGTGVVTRDGFTTLAMNTGESLRLHVTDTWSPTCAILHTEIPGPNGTFEPIDAADAETGPEGFWLSRDNDSFHSHATGSSSDYRNDLGLTIKACYGSPAVTKAAGASWEICAHEDFDWIHTNTNTTTGGSDSRTSASFASGIRLPTTPFPDAPAGSLVAVITPTGHPEVVIDIRVIHRDELITAPALAPGFGTQVDLHLVVNDLGTCGGAGGGLHSLQIEGVKSIPLGNVAKAIGAAMATTLTAIEAQAPAILAQGQLTPDEASAIRATAWNTVQQQLTPLSLGLAGLPYDLHQLFDGFLEREIASIGRRGQLHALARERLQLQLAADGIAHEIAFDDAQNRLLMLIPRWRLRDLSGVELALATDALSEALSTEVAQVYQLRDPAAFSQFRTTVNTQLGAIVDLNLTAAYEDSVAALEAFATAARNALVAATFELPTDFRRTIVIAIPKTVTVCNGKPCDYRSQWTSVSSTTAKAFWTAAAAAPFGADVAITPSDFYSAIGTGRLACSDVAPVVRRMALYLDTDDSEINLSTLFLEATGTAAAAGAPVAFPLVGDTLMLEADAAAGVPLSLPVINGNVTSVAAQFGPSPTELGIGAGLSPFTTFHLDMTPFQTGTPKNALAVTGAALLVFEVERRLSTTGITLPGVCTPTP